MPSAIVMDFRGQAGEIFLYNGTVQICGTHVNACLALKTEETRERTWLPFLAAGPVLRRHLIASVEDVNFGYIGYRSIPELDNRKSEIAGLLRIAAESLLKRAVRAANREQRVEVSGELREHWPDPRPEIAGFHRYIDNFMKGLHQNGLSEIPAGRFSFQRQGLDHIAMIEGEPDVIVHLPAVNREDPDFYEAMVRIGSVKVPIGVQWLGGAHLDTILPAPRSEPRRQLTLYAVIHPYSKRVGVRLHRLKPSWGTDPETVTRAAKLMREAWTAWMCRAPEGSLRAEAIIL